MLLHFSSSIFGTYRWINKFCPLKEHKNCIKNNEAHKCSKSEAFSKNFIPYYFEVKYHFSKKILSEDEIYRKIIKMPKFLPFYLKQEISIYYVDEKEKFSLFNILMNILKNKKRKLSL